MGFTREIHQEDILKMINTKALRFVYEMAEIGWFHKKRNGIKYALGLSRSKSGKK